MALETISRNKMNWTAVTQPLKNKSKLWIAVGFNVTYVLLLFLFIRLNTKES